MRPSLSIVAQTGVICECAAVTVPIACEQSHNCNHDDDHRGNRDVDSRRRICARKIHVITLWCKAVRQFALAVNGKVKVSVDGELPDQGRFRPLRVRG
jgi:hypothetical protein